MSEGITISGRLGSSPRLRGSTSGATCPDLLSLDDGAVGVIGELPDSAEQVQDETYIVVPATVVFDALADVLRA